jgi:hypothetical protein
MPDRYRPLLHQVAEQRNGAQRRGHHVFMSRARDPVGNQQMNRQRTS